MTDLNLNDPRKEPKPKPKQWKGRYRLQLKQNGGNWVTYESNNDAEKLKRIRDIVRAMERQTSRGYYRRIYDHKEGVVVE